MADRTVRVALTAQVQGYIDGMQKAAQATRETGAATEKLAQQQQAFEDMGRAAMVAGGAIAAGLGLSAKAAIDWESAWAGVTKTVEGSPAQLAQIESGLRGLAEVLPASHTEIAAVAEAAGQLGIQTPNVVAFTKTMIDLGETTNLSADQAATSLAQMMNIMGTSQDEVDRMGATLVALGNAGASTESEILMMAQRIAGAGKLVGATEGEVLGLANALASMGVTAELGGGVASRILQDLYNAVQEGGESLAGFAKVAGTSSQEFAQAFQNDPVRALDLFAKGLNGVEASGGNVVATLNDLGFKSTEEQRVLLQLKGAGDLLTDSLDLQAKAWAENIALTEEAEKRYNTTEAKLGMMRNKVVDAAIVVGEQLLPALNGVADGVGNFADMISGFDGPAATFVAWSGVAASGVLLFGGAALAAVPKIAAYKIALDTLGISTSALARGARGTAAFLTGPWGVAMLAAGIASAQFNQALDNSVVSSEALTNSLKQGESALTAMQATAGSNEQGFTKAFVDVSQHLENLPALADKAAEAGRGFWSSMSFNENAALDAVAAFGESLTVLAAKDLPEAQQHFQDFFNESGLNDKQAITLMNEEMVGFKSALIDSAAAAGIATDDASLLKFALGEIGPAADGAAKGVDGNGEALSEFEQKAADAQDAIESLADEIRGFGSATFDMRDANRALEESYQTLTDSLAANGYNFEINSEAGRQNEAALDAVARATNEAAAGIVEATGDQDAMNAKLAEGKQKLIDILAPYFATRDAAAAYVDQLDLISPEKVTEFIANTGNAQAAIESYKASIAGIRETVVTSVQATVDILTNLGSQSRANGGIIAYENGGIHENMRAMNAFSAGGGVNTGIYSGGTPIIKFAEQETGWEAFISGKPSERDRNRQIWLETGDRLGMNEVLKALANGPDAVGKRGVSIGSVNFNNPQQRQNLRDLSDALDRYGRR